MKHLLLSLLITASLFAEATFDQVQSMIDKQQYKQAVLALTIINDNHPNSSKVLYTLAQAQAGLGNLPAAREALDKAIAINPALNFVPQSSVDKLKQAIQPQTQLIAKVESESHWFLWILLMTGVSFIFAYFIRSKPKPVVEPIKPSPKYDEPIKPSKPIYSEPSISKSNDESPVIVNQPFRHPYSQPVKEVHHHHTSNSSSDTLSTVVTAGLTAAVVSSLMSDHDSYESKPTHSYQPEPLSNSWNDSSDSSSSWDDESTSKSSSWDSSSDSSSSSSWSDSSSSSDSWSSSSDSSSSSSND